MATTELDPGVKIDLAWLREATVTALTIRQTGQVLGIDPHRERGRQAWRTARREGWAPGAGAAYSTVGAVRRCTLAA